MIRAKPVAEPAVIRHLRRILRHAIPLTAGAVLFAAFSPQNAAPFLPFAPAEALAAPSSSPYSRQELIAQESGNEREVRQLREKQIREIEVVLARRMPEDRRADLYLRLAELHLEAYRADFILEGRVFEKKLAGGRTGGSIDRSQSKPSLKRAIAACDQILALRLDYPKLDQVLFFLGYAADELGDEKRASTYYERITRQFPSSPAALQAEERLGTEAWDAGDYRTAAAHFERSLSRDADRETAPAIRHKLAWCYYRQKRFADAVKTMQAAIESASRSGEKLLSLREEALRDLALFYTEIGKVDEAIKYFDEVAGRSDFYAQALEKLGRQYERNLEPEKAIQVYETLLATEPGEEASFRVLVKLVDLELRRGRIDAAMARVRGKSGSAHGRISEKFLANDGASETQVALQNLRAMVRRTATESHERFRKRHESGALKLAESAYETYLDPLLAAWDPRDETPEIRMYLADVKKELGKTVEAADLYRKVIDSKDERYAREAGALWTAALADQIGAGTGAGKKPSADRKKPSEKEQQFVDAADELYEKLGDAREGREAAVRAAQVLAGYDESKSEAQDRAEKIVKAHSGTPQGVTAARLWLQLVSDRVPKDAGSIGDSGEAKALSGLISQLRSNSALMAHDKATGAHLAEALAAESARLEVGAIASSEKEGNFAEAAKGYLAYARSAKSADAAEKGYLGAVQAQLKVDDLTSAARTLKEWNARPGRHAGLDSVARTLAVRQFIMGDFKASAESFGVLASRLEKEPRIGALVARGGILSGLDEVPAAIEVFSTVLRDSSSADTRALARLRKGELLLRRSEAPAVIKLWTEKDATLSSAMAGEFALRAALLAQSRGDTASERRALMMAEESSGPAAKIAKFIQAADDVEARRAKLPKLALPGAALVKAVEARISFVDQANRSLAAAAGELGSLQLEARVRASLLALEFAGEIDEFAKKNSAVSAAQSSTKIAGTLRSQALNGLSAVWDKVQADGALLPVLASASEALARGPEQARYLAIGPAFAPRLVGMGTAAEPSASELSQKLARSRARLKEEASKADAWIEHAALLNATGRPAMAAFALDQALALQPSSPGAIADRATLDWISSGLGVGDADLVTLLRTSEAWEKALASKDGAASAVIRSNLAGLHGRMRSFGQARSLLDGIPASSRTSASWDLLGAALYSMGQFDEANSGFNAAEGRDAPASRFARRFHSALETWRKQGAGSECSAAVQAVSRAGIADSERAALDALRVRCANEGGHS